jgi:predicted HTH domain antitoxin
MTTVCLQIPDEAYQALRLPPEHAEEALKHEFAVFLVKEGLLSAAQARKVADLGRIAFQDLLARRRVPWAGSVEDVQADLLAARAAARSDRS